MSVNAISSESFDKLVLQNDKPVLVDFWAPWCTPCSSLSPVIESVAKKYGDKYFVCSVNVDNEKELAATYDVMSIPTLVVFSDGKVVSRSTGVKSENDVINMLEKAEKAFIN